jgi:hypothetical protein
MQDGVGPLSQSVARPATATPSDPLLHKTTQISPRESPFQPARPDQRPRSQDAVLADPRRHQQVIGARTRVEKTPSAQEKGYPSGCDIAQVAVAFFPQKSPETCEGFCTRTAGRGQAMYIIMYGQLALGRISLGYSGVLFGLLEL